MKKLSILLLALITLSAALTSCSENYSQGERIGFITKFTQKGWAWKSWEAEMNVSQTGMTSNATEFDFSVDNDLSSDATATARATLDSAASLGWKVKVKYHETVGKNWFENRGETNHFVQAVEVIDKHPMQSIFGQGNGSGGKAVDTIYVVIQPKQKL